MILPKIPSARALDQEEQKVQKLELLVKDENQHKLPQITRANTTKSACESGDAVQEPASYSAEYGTQVSNQATNELHKITVGRLENRLTPKLGRVDFLDEFQDYAYGSKRRNNSMKSH